MDVSECAEDERAEGYPRNVGENAIVNFMEVTERSLIGMSGSSHRPGGGTMSGRIGAKPRCPQDDPHTPIAAGLEQLVMLTRAPFRIRNGGRSAASRAWIRVLP